MSFNVGRIKFFDGFDEKIVNGCIKELRGRSDDIYFLSYIYWGKTEDSLNLLKGSIGLIYHGKYFKEKEEVIRILLNELDPDINEEDVL